MNPEAAGDPLDIAGGQRRQPRPFAIQRIHPKARSEWPKVNAICFVLCLVPKAPPPTSVRRRAAAALTGQPHACTLLTLSPKGQAGMLADRLTGTPGRDCKPADDWRVRAVIEMLEQNYQRRLPVGELASAVNLSVSRLDSLFRQWTGSPPSAYLKLLRLQRGKTLLETTFRSIKEIAACVGFNDAGRFVKQFKTRYGQPPGRWRSTFRAAAETPELS